MARCVLIGGAEIKNYHWIKKQLQSDDFYIFCDSGLRHSQPLGISPHLIVGDFDSTENPHLSVETIVLPREKDDTDSVYGVKEGLKRGFTDFVFLGVIGGRLDHSLGNLSILYYLHVQGGKGIIFDDYSSIELVTSKKAYVKDTVEYFSVLSIFGKSSGITIKNAKYPLVNGKIDMDYQYGISNEVLSGKVAEISVKKGELLLIKVYTEKL